MRLLGILILIFSSSLTFAEGKDKSVESPRPIDIKVFRDATVKKAKADLKFSDGVDLVAVRHYTPVGDMQFDENWQTVDLKGAKSISMEYSIVSNEELCGAQGKILLARLFVEDSSEPLKTYATSVSDPGHPMDAERCATGSEVEAAGLP